MLKNEVYEVEVRQWDWQSPFGSTPAAAARKSWGEMWGEGTPVALVYARDIEAGEDKLTFTGYAEPFGEHTADELEAQHLARLTEQKAERQATAAAAVEAARTPTPDERIAAAMEFQNVLQMPESAAAQAAPEKAVSFRSRTAAAPVLDPQAERIRRNYERGLWTAQMLAVAVTKNFITQEQCDVILRGDQA